MGREVHLGHKFGTDCQDPWETLWSHLSSAEKPSFTSHNYSLNMEKQHKGPVVAEVDSGAEPEGQSQELGP